MITDALLMVLIVLLIVVAILGFIFLFIYFKFKSIIKSAGFSDIRFFAREIKNSSEEIKREEKSISGMTKLIEPRILNDFPKFNKNEMYSMCERDLRTYFKCLEDKTTDGLDSMPLLKETITNQIKDLNDDNTKVNYSNITFHNFAIKNYEKKDGAATVEIATTLKYAYNEYVNNKLKKEEKIYETRYSVKYIYIYDVNKFNKYEHVFGINCPNCGAALRDLGAKHCQYCQSAVEDINLTSWQVCSLKEY